MPSSTPRAGLPYPLGTDPQTDGDDLIKQLAERLDGSTAALASVPFSMAQGAVTHNFSASSQSSVAVTFPVGRFTQTPRIFQSLYSNALNGCYAPRMASAPTITGYTAVLNTTTATTGSPTVSWFAIQMTSSTPDG